MAWLSYKDHFFDELAISTEADRQRLATLINAACEYVESYCNRQFESQTHTDKVFDVMPDGSVFLDSPPVTSITSVALLSAEGTSANSFTPTWETYTGSLYVSENGIIDAGFPRGAKVKVTYVSGYSDVPEAIKQVAANLAKSSFSGSAGRIKSENLGGYSYSLEDPEKMPMADRRILNMWKDRRI